MNFPKCLLHKGRITYPSTLIFSFNFMFMRCPRSDWEEGDDYPEFSKIKPEQSFNWSVFSLPLWARFTDMMEYKDGYGVIGYKVKTIREPNKINQRFERNLLSLNHKPIENNYSHCELFTNKKLEKKDRRDLRMTFKHNCIRPILPSMDRSKIQLLYDYMRMYSHRAILKIGNFQIKPKIF
jgi:hypothetical protein